METNRNKKSVLDLMDNIELDLLQNDSEYAKLYLEDEGVNLQEEKEFAAQYIKKITFKIKAISNKKQDSTMLEKAFVIVKKAIAQRASETSEALIAILQKKTPSVQYRKLENWTDDEIREVLLDVDLIKLMEELDKE